MWDWHFVERFQTLISGVLAITAAVVTAWVIYRAAHASIKAERDIRTEEAAARSRAHALALLVEVQHLIERAGHIRFSVFDPDDADPISTIVAEWRLYFRLDTPPSLQDWHLAAAHSPPIPDCLKNLALTLRRYQYYVDTVADWDPVHVTNWLERVETDARAVIKAIEDEYGLSARS